MYSAYNTQLCNRSISNIDRQELRSSHCQRNSLDRPINETCTDMYVSDFNVGSRFETSAESRNRTFSVICISDSEDDHKTESKQTERKQLNSPQGILSAQKCSQSAIVEQKANTSCTHSFEGILKPDPNDSQFSFEFIPDSELDNTDIWDSQTDRETCKNSIVQSQIDIDLVVPTQNSRKSDVNSVLLLRSSGTHPNEVNSVVNLQVNVPSSSNAAVIPMPNVDSKPTRRKLFNQRTYNESRELPPRTQSAQTNAKIDSKTVFHLTDDPYRVLDLNYSSDELSNNLRSKRRPVNNATRFKSFRAKCKLNAVAEDSELMSRAGQYSVPKVARIAATASRHSHPPLVKSNAFNSAAGCKKRRLNSTEVYLQNSQEHDGDSETEVTMSNLSAIAISSNIPSNRTQNPVAKLAKKRCNTSMEIAGESVQKKPKLLSSTQEAGPSQANETQSLGIVDHSESVLLDSEATVTNFSLSQCNENEKKFRTAILLEIEKQKQLWENVNTDEIDEETDNINELILEGNKFAKETRNLLSQVSVLYAKTKIHTEKVFRCGNKATDVHAEQLKKFEAPKLYSANILRQIISDIGNESRGALFQSVLMAKGELLQRVLDHL